MPGVAVDRAVAVRGLEKSYGDIPVLWGLDITVSWGELVALLGANGVGKSTLLRILSTQTRPDAGSLEVAGLDVRRQASAVRRNIGVLAHSNFLYDDLTCLENLTYYARLFNLSNPRQRALDTLAMLGLSDRAHQRTRNLSHGLRKRVAIARTILHRPRVLLMDEPESGLDTAAIASLRETLKDWTVSGGAVLMTTHNAAIATSWADRVGVLANGGVQFLSDGQSRTSDHPMVRDLATAVSRAVQ